MSQIEFKQIGDSSIEINQEQDAFHIGIDKDDAQDGDYKISWRHDMSDLPEYADQWIVHKDAGDYTSDMTGSWTATVTRVSDSETRQYSWDVLITDPAFEPMVSEMMDVRAKQAEYRIIADEMESIELEVVPAEELDTSSFIVEWRGPQNQELASGSFADYGKYTVNTPETGAYSATVYDSADKYPATRVAFKVEIISAGDSGMREDPDHHDDEEVTPVIKPHFTPVEDTVTLDVNEPFVFNTNIEDATGDEIYLWNLDGEPVDSGTSHATYAGDATADMHGKVLTVTISKPRANNVEKSWTINIRDVASVSEPSPKKKLSLYLEDYPDKSYLITKLGADLFIGIRDHNDTDIKKLNVKWFLDDQELSPDRGLYTPDMILLSDFKEIDYGTYRGEYSDNEGFEDTTLSFEIRQAPALEHGPLEIELAPGDELQIGATNREGFDGAVSKWTTTATGDVATQISGFSGLYYMDSLNDKPVSDYVGTYTLTVTLDGYQLDPLVFNVTEAKNPYDKYTVVGDDNYEITTKNQSVNFGLAVEPEASVASSIVWTKDDVILEDKTDLELALNNITEADEGVYKIVITSLDGKSWKREREIIVTVDIPEEEDTVVESKITYTPADDTVTVAVGGTIRLEVNGLSDDELPTWKYNDAPLSEPNSHSYLLIENAQESHAGKYSATTSGGEHSWTIVVSQPESDEDALEPPRPPVAPGDEDDTHDGNQDDDTGTVEDNDGSAPHPKDDDPKEDIPKGPEEDGETEDHPVDPQPTKKDIVIADIYPEETTVTIQEGSMFLMEVNTGPGDFTYKWYRDGKLLSGIEDKAVQYPQAIPDMNGTYKVVISGEGYNDAEQSWTVTVEPKVEVKTIQHFTRVGQSATVVSEGETVRIGTAAPETGDWSDVVYTWMKDGTPLDSATSAELVLTEVTPANTGIYTVTISKDGDVKTFDFDVRITATSAPDDSGVTEDPALPKEPEPNDPEDTKDPEVGKPGDGHDGTDDGLQPPVDTGSGTAQPADPDTSDDQGNGQGGNQDDNNQDGVSTETTDPDGTKPEEEAREISLSETNLGIVAEGNVVSITASVKPENSVLQWYHVVDGQELAIDGQTNRELNITMGPAYGKEFFLRATHNGAYFNSERVVISKFVPAEVSLSSRAGKETFEEGGSMTYSFVPSPDDKYNTIEWYFQDASGAETKLEGEISNTLVVSPLSIADSGRYYAKVTRKGSAAEFRTAMKEVVVVEKHQPKQFEIRLEVDEGDVDSVVRPAGGTFVLRAIAVGEAQFTDRTVFKWQRRLLGHEPVVLGAQTTQVLQLSNLTAEDIGNYRVVVEGDGIGESTYLRLNVVDRVDDVTGDPSLGHEDDDDDDKMNPEDGTGHPGNTIPPVLDGNTWLEAKRGFFQSYLIAMAVGQPVAPQEGVVWQRRLYAELKDVIEHEDLDEFKEGMDMVVDMFGAYRRTLFSIEYRARFLEFATNQELSKDDREAFLEIMNVFATMADPQDSLYWKVEEINDIVRDDFLLARFKEYYAVKVATGKASDGISEIGVSREGVSIPRN